MKPTELHTWPDALHYIIASYAWDVMLDQLGVWQLVGVMVQAVFNMR